MPTVCSETCVGRIRYLGVLLYDADKILEVAATESEQDLYEKQLEVFLDPNDPAVIAQARQDGVADSVIEAAQRRLRPILLTTVTTLVGLIPLWTGGGPMFQPMAVTIIFGLAFATLLTLGIVPLLYSLLYRISFKSFQNQLEKPEE